MVRNCSDDKSNENNQVCDIDFVVVVMVVVMVVLGGDGGGERVVVWVKMLVGGC